MRRARDPVYRRLLRLTALGLLMFIITACSSNVYQVTLEEVGTRQLEQTHPVESPAEADKMRAQSSQPSVLRYYAWLLTANLEDVQAERRRIEAGWHEKQSVTDVVQMALILSASILATEAGEALAIDLLGSLSTDLDATACDNEYRDFAHIWKAYLLQRQDQRLARRDQAHAEKQLRELGKRNQELQQQIDALTVIEQQLIEREQPQQTQGQL